jgi:hypothetical protein
MKTKTTAIRQTILGVLFSLLYCLTLQRAIEYFLKYFKSVSYKTKVYCFPLQFNCISIAKAIAFHGYFKPVFYPEKWLNLGES